VPLAQVLPHPQLIFPSKTWFFWGFILNFSEEIIQYSRTFAWQFLMSWNQAHAPLLTETFPKTPRTQSEASRLSGSHNYETKQTTFITKLS